MCGCTAVSAQSLTVLYSFGAARLDGVDPMSGVVMGSNNKLYGTASVGGVEGNGLVYELAPPASAGAPWTETIIRRFIGPDGSIPECRLVVTPDGRLFGTTLNGGAHKAGIVFEMRPPSTPGDSWTEQILYSFGSFPGDGINPDQGLLAAKGAFFGVTFGGGASNQGTVFELKPPTGPGMPWTEHILYSFRGGSDGAFPSSELMIDQEGNLYGTTTLGGAGNVGTVFQLRREAGDSWNEKVVHSFSGADGSSPAGRLQAGADGAIFGTASGGGTQSSGTVFQLVHSSSGGGPWNYSVLYNFSGGSRDGGSPEGGVSIDRSGRLYGTAASGGRFASGVVFRLDPPSIAGGNWMQTVLHSLQHAEGFAPRCRLLLAPGAIYATATEGGAFGTGSVFLLTW
jgi:uncharacterized repeat protein (TIGR03803 family)